MTEDDKILLACYVIHLLCAVFPLIQVKRKRRFILINLVITLVYTSFFIFQYRTTGPGGGILAVFLMWGIVLCLHTLLYIIIGVVAYFVRRKEKMSRL